MRLQSYYREKKNCRIRQTISSNIIFSKTLQSFDDCLWNTPLIFDSVYRLIYKNTTFWKRSRLPKRRVFKNQTTDNVQKEKNV